MPSHQDRTLWRHLQDSKEWKVISEHLRQRAEDLKVDLHRSTLEGQDHKAKVLAGRLAEVGHLLGLPDQEIKKIDEERERQMLERELVAEPDDDTDPY